VTLDTNLVILETPFIASLLASTDKRSSNSEFQIAGPRFDGNSFMNIIIRPHRQHCKKW